MVDPVARKGYRFKGPATVYSVGPLFEQALAFYRNRGTTSAIQHIVLVKVERALPLIYPVYDQGKTEDEIRDFGCVTGRRSIITGLRRRPEVTTGRSCKHYRAEVKPSLGLFHDSTFPYWF